MTGFERVGRTDDIPLYEGRAATVGDRRIALFHLPDGFVALDAHCPHLAGPLADGIVADSCVSCPLHGWRFDLRTGAPSGGGATEGVQAHEVVERDGELFVRVPEPVLAAA